MLVEYYQSLFTSSSPNMIEAALEATNVVVMHEMNQELTAPFRRDEVDMALQ